MQFSWTLGVYAFASGLGVTEVRSHAQHYCSGRAQSCGLQCTSQLQHPPGVATLGITVCPESVISRDHGKNCASILAVLAGKTQHPGVLLQLFWDGKEPINMSDLGPWYSCFGEVNKGNSFLESSCLPSCLTSQSGLKRVKTGHSLHLKILPIFVITISSAVSQYCSLC